MKHNRRCPCGSQEFFAKQKCYHTVIVDDHGNFKDDVCIDSANDPYGSFQCVECGKHYEMLVDIPRE